MSTIYSIGYGQLDFESFLEAIKTRGVEYLVDVRSYPSSRFRPEFNSSSLSNMLAVHGIRYICWGKSLGGRPEGSEVLDKEGHIDYSILSRRQEFNESISRIVSAAHDGKVLCLMCSEGRPEECHRSKLIGESLRSSRIQYNHILPGGDEISHEVLRTIFIDKQVDLFGDRLRSRLKYGPNRKRRE